MQSVNGMQQMLRQRLGSMSPSQQRIARYALDHPDEVAFLSAQQLATRVDVSQSTVVRFPTVVGLEGYPQFQHSLQQELRRRLGPAERLGPPVDALGESLVQQVFAAEFANLQQTRELITDDDLRRACTLLVDASRVWVIGMRASYPQAHMTATLLRQIRPHVVLLDPGAGQLSDQLLDIEASDALVAITYPRYHAHTTAAARVAKRVGASVLSITDSNAAPVAEYTDELLRTACEGPSFPASHVGAAAVIHALAATAANEVGNAADRLKLLEDSRRDLATVLLDDGREPVRSDD